MVQRMRATVPNSDGIATRAKRRSAAVTPPRRSAVEARDLAAVCGPAIALTSTDRRLTMDNLKRAMTVITAAGVSVGTLATASDQTPVEKVQPSNRAVNSASSSLGAKEI